jgi:plastocyanin
MNHRQLIAFFLVLVIFETAHSQEADPHSAHQHHQMNVDKTGVVMNENLDTLPRDCQEISAELEFTIHAGREYAADEPGMIFGMSQHEVRVEPCSRITITFINDDSVRHQWMLHGLPKYLYPAGMFHIEVNGGMQKSGTLIAPGGDKTYLIHCDFAQHMEKGMRGQLVVGKGSGDLWGVHEISDNYYRSPYLPENVGFYALAALIMGFIAVLMLNFRSKQ